MEKFEHSQLQGRQQLKILHAIERLSTEAERTPREARKDAEDLKRFIHMLRALAFISPNERNYYIALVDGVFNEVRG